MLHFGQVEVSTMVEYILFAEALILPSANGAKRPPSGILGAGRGLVDDVDMLTKTDSDRQMQTSQ